MSGYAPVKERHLFRFPIPKTHQIYLPESFVRGITYHKEDAIEFVQARGQAISLEHEPDNPKDRHALKVLGEWNRNGLPRRVQLGYVPGDAAVVIGECEIFDVIIPRLTKTYLSEGGFVEVSFQLLGPKGGADAFREMLDKVVETYIPAGEEDEPDEDYEDEVSRVRTPEPIKSMPHEVVRQPKWEAPLFISAGVVGAMALVAFAKACG